MNQYIVIGNSGWYVENVLKNNPNYKGIDRFPWPLGEEEVKNINNLPAEIQNKALKCKNKIKSYNFEGDLIFCNDYNYAIQYYNLCSILNMDTDFLLCKMNIDNIKDVFSLFENNEEFIFIGFDYILTGAAYSCLVNEKELIDNVDEIIFNEYGLLKSLADIEKFEKLRNQAIINNNGIGFETGKNGVDFIPIALYKKINKF